MKPLTMEQARAYIKGESPEDLQEWKRKHLLSLIQAAEIILANCPTNAGLQTVRHYIEIRAKRGEDVLFPVEYSRLCAICREIDTKVNRNA